MARILSPDGCELCPLLAFVRVDGKAVGQTSADAGAALSAVSTDVLFEDDHAQRFRGRITGITHGTGSGRGWSMIIKADLLLDDVA